MASVDRMSSTSRALSAAQWSIVAIVEPKLVRHSFQRRGPFVRSRTVMDVLQRRNEPQIMPFRFDNRANRCMIHIATFEHRMILIIRNKAARGAFCPVFPAICAGFSPGDARPHPLRQQMPLDDIE